MEVSYNLVSALAAFSMHYDDFMHAVSRENRLVGHAHAEGRIIDNLRGRPQTQAQLRKVMRIERGQLSRAVKNLLAKGFIEPACPSPGSWPAYGLTALGWRHYNDSMQARFNAIETAVSKMLRPERKALIDALSELGKINFVDHDSEEQVRYRTAYPGEVAVIIKNALEFYSHKGLKFNSQIEGYVLSQFAEACERTHHYIIVFERHGYVAGSVLVLVDQKNASARFEGLWFAPGWCFDEDIVGVLDLAKKRASAAGCRHLTTRIPRHEAFPDIFREIGWKFVNVEIENIAGRELDIETWTLNL